MARVFRWKFKTLLKLCIAVFFASLLLFHYADQKYSKTKEIMKALGSRNSKEMVQPFTDTFLINNHWTTNDFYTQHPSRKGIEQEDPFMVIVVTSLPQNVHRRDIIRTSWMKYKTERRTIVVFFTGNPRSEDLAKLQKESDKHGDLIVDIFEENYYGLAVKTLRILKWFQMNLPNANFLVKTDDDVYINTPGLMNHLESVEYKIIKRSDTAENYIGGQVFSDRAPHTFNAFSKWFVPPKLWKDQINEISKITKTNYNYHYDGYPDYAEGNFYVISGHTVPLILNVSLELPLFHLEDIYVTGFIGSAILKIKIQPIPNIFTDSAIWPKWNYWYNKLLLESPKDIIAYHCDNDVEIIRQIYKESST